MPAFIPALLGIGTSLIERLIPDPEARAKAQLELTKLAQKGQLKELEAQMNTIVAEAQSESWLARNWRPITMLTFVGIIANNYIMFPYASAIGLPITYLEVPVDLWELIKIGLGGYIIGRSAEKTVKAYKEAGKDD